MSFTSLFRTHQTSIDLDPDVNMSRNKNKRFSEVSSKTFKSLLANRDSLSTKNKIIYSVTVLKYCCIEKGIEFPDETFEKQFLDNLLQKFYPATRNFKANGQLYSKKSML